MEWGLGGWGRWCFLLTITMRGIEWPPHLFLSLVTYSSYSSHLSSLVSSSPSLPDLSSPASPDFNTFSLLADLDDRQTTVPVSAFAESYVRSDPDNWCARMVLIERIAAIQDLIVQHMAVIEKEIEGRPLHNVSMCLCVCTYSCV